MPKPYNTSDEYKVMPNQVSLLIGITASGVLAVMFAGTAGWWRGIAVLLAGVFLVCFYQLFWPRPIIRANREGLYLSIGTFGSCFYVPWERVNGVVATQVWSPAGPDFSSPRDALGFVIRQDDSFRLPRVRWNAAGDDIGGVHSDINFEKSMIEGDVKTWVAQLEAFRKNVRGLS